jgi:hypothetical protein
MLLQDSLLSLLPSDNNVPHCLSVVPHAAPGHEIRDNDLRKALIDCSTPRLKMLASMDKFASVQQANEYSVEYEVD